MLLCNPALLFSAFGLPAFISWQKVPGTKARYTVNCSASWAHRGGLFKLYQEGSPTPVQVLKAPAMGQSVVFTVRSGRRYQCQYGSSLLSDNIWISTEAFPKPSISVQPATVLLQGENFAVWCQCSYPGVRFSLYKGRILIKEQDPTGHTAAVVFHIRNASLQDGGRYRCYYHTLAQPVLWSEPSDTLRINVEDIPHKPPILQDTLGTGSPTGNCSVPAGSFVYNQEDPRPQEKGWRSDFTEENIARMGLAVAVLVLTIVLVAHACCRNRSKKVERQWIQYGRQEAGPMLA
ncbi:immunoglobulin superfamily member 1 isoform X2 [Microcaecilia unicolor]|uniref:immunoglobulin superfamily member 1-like isoform X2 n=1 Tax=Microcaecilia unicolor TaxID=1415580 RepID=UPI0011856B17|nr:immunoglobulin superfamily member 1-like isoform X2 [Microcaecilia unicolor]